MELKSFGYQLDISRPIWHLKWAHLQVKTAKATTTILLISSNEKSAQFYRMTLEFFNVFPTFASVRASSWRCATESQKMHLKLRKLFFLALIFKRLENAVRFSTLFSNSKLETKLDVGPAHIDKHLTFLHNQSLINEANYYCRQFWVSKKKCGIWILAFSPIFCHFRIDLSGDTVWPQTSGFQKLAKINYFCSIKM